MAVSSSRSCGSKFLLCLMFLNFLALSAVLLTYSTVEASGAPSQELIEQAAAGDEEKESELVGEVLHKATEDIQETIEKVNSDPSATVDPNKRQNEKKMLEAVKEQIDEVGHHPGIAALTVPDEEATAAQKCMKKVFIRVMERTRTAVDASQRAKKAAEEGKEVGEVESEGETVEGDFKKESEEGKEKEVVKTITETLGEPNMSSMKKAAEAAETVEKSMPTLWNEITHKGDAKESGIDVLTIVASVLQSTESGGVLSFTPAEKAELDKCAKEQEAIDSSNGVRNLRGGGFPEDSDEEEAPQL